MKIYTILSASHQFLFDNFFLPSLTEYEPDCEIVVKEQPQICDSGNYYDKGWKESMEYKIDAYIEAVNDSGSKFFIWSDVDIEFYNKFIDQCILELGEHDIAFQEGVGQEYCAGFFICKINDRTKHFFDTLKNTYQNYTCDQQAINHQIKLINAKFLSRKFLNISFQHRQWNGQNIDIHEPIHMFHANYTVGIQHKIMLLTHVKNQIHNIKNTLFKNNHNIKIIHAFYGLYEDITKNIDLSNLTEISACIHALNLDPIPGARKYLYFLDKEHKIIYKPVREGDIARLQ